MTKTTNIQQDTDVPKGYKKTPLGVIPKEWEVKKLGDISIKIGSGITPRGGERVYKTEGRFFLRSQNIGWGNLLLNDVAYIDEKTHTNQLSSEIKTNDVLLNITGASIGRSAIATSVVNGGNVNQHVCIIRLKNGHNPYYLNSFIISFNGQKLVDSYQAGGNRQGLNFEQIASFPIPLPPLPEQQKIAEILSTWDVAIEKQNALIEQLELRKRGLMQQLLTGKLRLLNAEGERFKGEWKKVRLGEVGDLMNGYAFKSETYKEGGRFKVITIANVQKGKLDLEEVNSIESIPLDIQEHQILKKGDMLISMTGNVGRICIVNEEYCLLNQRVGLIKVNDKKVLTKFLFYQISTNHFISEMQNKAQGGAQDNLGKYDILSYKLNIPSLSEQTAIAEVLSTADREIEIEKQKLTALQNQKKGLMQVLLSGRVRVKVSEQ